MARKSCIGMQARVSLGERGGGIVWVCLLSRPRPCFLALTLNELCLSFFALALCDFGAVVRFPYEREFMFFATQFPNEISCFLGRYSMFLWGFMLLLHNF